MLKLRQSPLQSRTDLATENTMHANPALTEAVQLSNGDGQIMCFNTSEAGQL